MYLLNILALHILDAIRKIEGWIEYAVVDNDESPLLTTAGLWMALIFGLWNRYIVPLFRIHAGEVSGIGRAACMQPVEGPRGSGSALECRFDLQGRVIDVPSAAGVLTGHSRESMIGSLFSRFLPDGDVAAIVDGSIPPADASGWLLAISFRISSIRTLGTSTIINIRPCSIPFSKVFSLELGMALATMLDTHAPKAAPISAEIRMVTNCSERPSGGKKMASSPATMPAMPPTASPSSAPWAISVLCRIEASCRPSSGIPSLASTWI